MQTPASRTKWFFRTRADAADVGPALALLAGVASGAIALLEPAHFVAEVAAVFAREAPHSAAANMRDLLAVEMRVEADDAVYQRALSLALRHKHHLFDTLYHALALCTPGAVLVTADEGQRRRHPPPPAGAVRVPPRRLCANARR